MSSLIFGVRLDELETVEQLRSVAGRFLNGDRTHLIFTPNPEILLRARSDPGYADLLRSADLALPDGTGVALVQMLRHGRSVRRWPGVEVAAFLIRLAAERGETVAFVGGGPGVAERAASRWRALPGLKVVVAGAGLAFDGDGRAGTTGDDDAVVETIRSPAPTIVLVGLGAPKQERWIERHADAFPSARIMVGVGGAFDMWAGSRRRAPRPLRTVGLEWLWRLALEPGRLPRIVRATVVFPVLALLDRVG
jgi:N-acetylglucosaminyldiphosphoundecaprenol N-acetyl-beta-D-mannosaminyltransferase